MNVDVAIIGGGIIGAACAMRLSEEGLSVALVEQRYIGAGSTSAGMGHIVVMDDSEAQFALTNLSRQLWNEMAGILPESNEFENCGTIWVAADIGELEEARKKERFYKERGASAELIDADRLYDLEPHLRKGLAGGLFVKDDSVVYQLGAASFFAERAVAKGAVILSGTTVESISEKEISLADTARISTEYIVNAAGLAATLFSPEIKIESKKGHLVITDRYPGFVSHQIIELGYLRSAHGSEKASVAFNIQPRITGQLLIGSSRQPRAKDNDVDNKTVQKMLNRAFEFLPELSELKAIRTWTGTRPASPDNLPYIGRSTSNTNVIVAAGHEGLGITTSLGTAELVVDEILERKSRIPREPYLPGRFAE
jgi:glycine/D-amino acid oxidase-like deaminating enzyme